jgi:hypothetical protein
MALLAFTGCYRMTPVHPLERSIDPVSVRLVDVQTNGSGIHAVDVEISAPPGSSLWAVTDHDPSGCGKGDQLTLERSRQESVLGFSLSAPLSYDGPTPVRIGNLRLRPEQLANSDTVVDFVVGPTGGAAEGEHVCLELPLNAVTSWRGEGARPTAAGFFGVGLPLSRELGYYALQFGGEFGLEVAPWLRPHLRFDVGLAACGDAGCPPRTVQMWDGYYGLGVSSGIGAVAIRTRSVIAEVQVGYFMRALAELFITESPAKVVLHGPRAGLRLLGTKPPPAHLPFEYRSQAWGIDLSVEYPLANAATGKHLAPILNTSWPRRNSASSSPPIPCRRPISSSRWPSTRPPSRASTPTCTRCRPTTSSRP